MDKILVCVFLVFVFASSLSFLLLWHVTIYITKKYTELIHQLLFSDYLRLFTTYCMDND
jgi:hypothetical protein